MRQKVCAVALVSLIVSASVGWAQGQGAPATIEGRISDTQQLPLPGATVEVQDSQGTTIKKIIGQYDGNYRVAGIPSGTYTVLFSRDGFQTVKKEKVVAAADQTVTLDAVLSPQEVSVRVTVTAQVEDQNVASKTDIPNIAMPVTVDTVSLDMIRQQGSTSIVPVINNMPASNAWTQYGSLNYFEFRGMVMDQDPGSAILLNGLPIQGNRSDSQLNYVQQVDVLKGPASMLYGTQDPGGTIDILEKQPLDASHQEIVVRGGQWGTAGVEFGSTGPLTSSRDLLYRADVAYIHSDGFRGAGYNRFNFTPQLFWRITPRDLLRFNVNWNDDHFNLDAGIPLLPLANPLTATTPYGFIIPPNVSINNRYNTPGNFENLNQPIVQVFYTHDFSDNLRLRSSAEYQYIGDQYWDSEANAIDTSTMPYQVLRGNSINPNTYSLYFFHRDQVALSQTDLVGSFHLLWKHQFMIGYEYDYHYHKTARSTEAENLPIPPIALYNPAETATAVTSFPVSSYDGTHNTQNAVYFQDFVQLHPKLQLLFGGRYDEYRHYDFNYPVVNGVWQYGGPQNIFPQNPFTYRVGLISQILPYLALYANVATSFTAQVEVSLAGNALLPETGRQVEVGARMNFLENRLYLNVNYFHINEWNIAVTRADGTIDQANAMTSYGAEFLARASITQKLNVYASYGYTNASFGTFILPGYFNPDVDVNLAGNVPPLVPKHTEVVWVNYDLPKGFNFSVGERYISQRATDIYDLFWMPGYVTFDAQVLYRSRRAEYALNLFNFSNNKHYYVSAIDDTQVYPGPPINVTGTIRYRF